MAKRKAGTLVPIELQLLKAAVELAAVGNESFHGYTIARSIATDDRRSLLGHGTIYKALFRLEEQGLLVSSWEDPAAAAAERRPPRRLYRLTPDGRRAALAPVEPPQIHSRRELSAI